MSLIAIQYLEGQSHIPVKEALDKLRAAFDILPIEKVLLGWYLPESLITMCAEECQKNRSSLYRWQPLLTGDGNFQIKPEWYTIGINNKPVPGFQQLPEFTFACPNRREVKEAVLNNIRRIIDNGPYQGIFLDRIRFPSPTADPGKQLACFCEACKRKTNSQGLDLKLVQKSISSLLSEPKGIKKLIHLLFDSEIKTDETDTELKLVQAFLSFRAESISSFIRDTAQVINHKGLSVGLDCFSPALAHAVGQDLNSLADCADWIKIMSYAHTFGVAGLPFEFIHIIKCLIQKQRFTEPEAIQLLAEATHLPFPKSIKEIREKGFSSGVLAIENKRAQKAGIKKCLAGIELVDEGNLTNLNQEQITTDLEAFRDAGANGLVLSWDLWFMPLERLELVRDVWRL